MVTDRRPLIGREAERQRLGALVDAARSGRSAVLCLVGEPGVGKSALVDELAATAADADVLVVHAMLTRHAADSSLADVVALPQDLGRQASEAGGEHLVLGHLMSSRATGKRMWSLAAVEDVVAGISESYAGLVSLARDGQCVALP